MRFVVVVEVKMGVVTEAAGLLEFADFEDVVNMVSLVAQNLADHWAARTLLQILAIFLANPAYAADVPIKFGRKFCATEADHVDILAGRTADRQHLLDTRVWIAPVTLSAGQSLKLDGSA